MRSSGRKGPEIVKRRIQLLQKYKVSQGCKLCGYNEHAVALDFAHRNPEEKHIEMVRRRGGNGIDNLYRRVTIRDKVKNRFYIRELIAEIRKCDVLCKNCHVVHTYNNKECNRNKKLMELRGGSYKDRGKAIEEKSTLDDFLS